MTASIGKIKIAPISEPPKIAKTAPFQPQNAPIRPTRSTSPSPIASRRNMISALSLNQYKMPEPTAMPVIAHIIDAIDDAKNGTPSILALCISGRNADNIKPSAVPPTVAMSGNSIVSISTNVQNIKIEMNTIPTSAFTIGNIIHNVQNKTAVSNSTNGYLKDILPPQQRALPRKKNQARIGILSYHLISLPHAQCDGGRTIDSPLGIRSMQTFKKLPVHAPNKKATMGKKYGNSVQIACMFIRRYLLKFCTLAHQTFLCLSKLKAILPLATQAFQAHRWR